MRNIKLEKVEKIDKISREIGELEKGDLKSREVSDKAFLGLVLNYSTEDKKTIKDYEGKKVKMVCGHTESFGRFNKYKKSYEEIVVIERRIKSITENWVIFENNTRVRLDRVYAIVK